MEKYNTVIFFVFISSIHFVFMTYTLQQAEKEIRRVTEASPITFFPTGDGNGVYPYVVLPFEGDDQLLEPFCTGLAYTYVSRFGIATTLVYPESKAFSFNRLSSMLGLRGVFTRKREGGYGTPGEVEITIATPYRGDTSMYCIGLKDEDRDLLIVDDMISRAGTMGGHIEAFGNAGRNVIGGMSCYERGDGLETLRGRYPDLRFEGFARLEIIPRPGKERGIRDMLGDPDIDETELAGLYLEHLRGETPADEFFGRRAELLPRINEHLQPRIPRFFDK